MQINQVLKQSQKLIMSPQMQQAIHLLQLPMMELSALIDQELVQNPVLEEIEGDEETSTDLDAAEIEEASIEEDINSDGVGEEISFEEEFDRLSHLDDDWKDFLQSSGPIQKVSEEDQKKRKYLEDSMTKPETIEEHLKSQFHLLDFTEEELLIADQFVGNLDTNGFLKISLEEVQKPDHFEIEDVEDVLLAIQTLHPVGVAARNLNECLLIQLERLGKGQSIEAQIVANYLNELGRKNISLIAKNLQISVKEVQNAATFISTLEPKPGRMFDVQENEYVVPDVTIEKVGDDYVVQINNEYLPRLRISATYKKLMHDENVTTKTKQYIKEKVQAGKWLVKNIQQRQDTLRKIMETIISEQRDFFDQGAGYLKPLTMQTVADQIELHESTVSRAIANKYVDTPRGLFQIKYFFTSGIHTANGQDESSTNIKEKIQQIVKGENPMKPFSDQQLVSLLDKEGIQIARRTVTKYRKEMKILPTHLRKTYR